MPGWMISDNLCGSNIIMHFMSPAKYFTIFSRKIKLNKPQVKKHWGFSLFSADTANDHCPPAENGIKFTTFQHEYVV